MRTDELLLPGSTGPSFANMLRSVAIRLRWEETERLGTLTIRKGAAGSILRGGGIFAQRLKAYRPYLDLGAEDVAAMTKGLS